MFIANLTPSNNNDIDVTYRILGDGVLLYTSPTLRSNEPSVEARVNVVGVNELRIEFQARNNSTSNLNFGTTNGITNARVIV